MKLPFILFLFLSIAISAGAQQKETSALRQSEKQKAAEGATDRILQRFYETLDFGVVYREMYVSDPDVRRLEVEIITDNMMGGWDAHRKVDLAARERAYIAYANFEWLTSALEITQVKDPESKELDKLGDAYRSLLTDVHKHRILTTDSLDTRVTSLFRQLNDQIRKYVVRENFNTAAYKAKVSQIAEDQPDERSELKELFLGVGSLRSDTEIYVVRREHHYFYLIEENGSFKLLTTSSRHRF